jgi:hypothetical protein
MSDDTSPHGTGNQGQDRGASGAPAQRAPGPGTSESWTPPPPSSAPSPVPAPQTYQARTDSTGGVPVTGTGGGASLTLTPGLVFALLAIVGIVLAVLLKEAGIADRTNAEGVPQKGSLWDVVGGLWSIAAIAAAVLTLLPALRSVANLDAKRAWMIGAAGAAFLVFWWVVFLLPSLRFNVSFLATLAVVAAVLAVWTSPGNLYKSAADDTSS